MNKKTWILFVGAALAGFGLYLMLTSHKNSVVSVKLPAQFSQLAQEGQIQFEENCMVCHGKNGAGTDQGPPFIHIIYEPNHHSDKSFLRAAKNGVRAHHWPFGDMPPQPQVREEDITAIVAYIREIQKANGIF